LRVDLVKFNSIPHWSYFSKDSHKIWSSFF